MLNIIVAVVTVAYPALVYFGFQHLPSWVFAVVLIALFGLRLMLAKRLSQATWTGPVSLALVAFGAIVLLVQSSELLLYYPVIINLCLLAVFGYSLRHSPTIIERLARIQESDLDPSGVAYTRKVTWVWCFFFASTQALPSTRPSLLI